METNPKKLKLNFLNFKLMTSDSDNHDTIIIGKKKNTETVNEFMSICKKNY